VAEAPSSELRGLRTARGLTLARAAARGETTSATVSRWESGQRTPRPSEIQRYLTGLEVPPRTVARLLAAFSAHDQIAQAKSDIGAPVGLGTGLRAMRARRGMTQAELARAAGMTQGAVAKWESGESIPSASTIHALGFALGATAEETIALGRLQGEGTPPGGWTDPETALRRIAEDLRVPRDLEEVVLCGVEAEAWRWAARDSRWDVVLVSLLSRRAFHEYFNGRPGLGRPTAMRAIRLATPDAIRTSALHALDIAWTVGQRRDADPNFILATAERFIASLPEGSHRGWALWVRGKALAALGRRAEAYEDTERGIAMTPNNDYVGSGHAWMGIAARIDIRLAAGDARGALSVIDHDPYAYEDFGYCIRACHANGLAAPDEWMDNARHHYNWWGRGQWLGRQRFKALEVGQAQLQKGSLRTPVV